METRSDYTLEVLLRETVTLCRSEVLRAVVIAVVDFMNSAPAARFRRGPELIRLLEAARAHAASIGENEVLIRLDDATEYASGGIYQQDLETKYKLFGGGKEEPKELKFVRQMSHISFTYCADVCSEMLDEQPEIIGSEMLARLKELEADSQFMEGAEESPGTFRIVRGRAERVAWMRDVFETRIDIEDADEAARRMVTSPEAMALFAQSVDGDSVRHAAELHRRRASLLEVKRKVADPTSTEAEIQASLKHESWIFGGRYVGIGKRRRLVDGDELDIPLLRPDGSLCVVELKRARTNFLTQNHSELVPNANVHHAVGQAINYLRNLDEHRNQIWAEHAIETRRACAIVVIGHSSQHPEIPRKQINEALRTYNAHLSRIEVLTYDELLDAAERSVSPEHRSRDD